LSASTQIALNYMTSRFHGKYAQFSVLDINGKFAKIPLLKNKIGPKSPFFVCKTDLWI